VTVRVPAALKNRLDKWPTLLLAAAPGCGSRAWVYVEDQEWQLATIRKGKKDVQASRVVSHEARRAGCARGQKARIGLRLMRIVWSETPSPTSSKSEVYRTGQACGATPIGSTHPRVCDGLPSTPASVIPGANPKRENSSWRAHRNHRLSNVPRSPLHSRGSARRPKQA